MIDLNLTIVISLAVLAFFSFCLFVVIVPVAFQMSRTLNSMQHLLDTINDDLEPTVNQIKQSMGSVKSGLHKARILVMSSTYGILTGLKDYLKSYKSNETSYNNKSRVGEKTRR